MSKGEADVSQAAANAITILVRAGVLFNGADLRGIKIPGADLSEGQFDSAQLQDADLTGVRLQRTWLRQADFQGANMTDVRFGVNSSPYIAFLYSSAVSSNGAMIGVLLERDEETDMPDHRADTDTSECREVTSMSDRREDANMYDNSDDDEDNCGMYIFDTSGSWRRLHSHSLKGQVQNSNNLLAISNSGSHVALSWAKDIKTETTQKSLLSVWSSLRDGSIPLDKKILNRVHSAAFSHDDQWLVTVSGDGDIPSVFTKILSRSDNVTVSGDTMMRVWDVTSDKCRLVYTHDDTDFHARRVAWFSDGQRIAAGGWYKDDSQWQVRVWNLESCDLGLFAHTSLPISCIAISPDDQYLVAGCRQRKGEKSCPNLYLWDLRGGASRRCLMSEYTCSITGVTFFGDGQWIVASSDDEWIRVWSSQTGHLVRSWRGNGKLGVASVNDEKIISTCGISMNLWDLSPKTDFLQAESRRVVVPHGDEDGVLCVEYSPDDSSILSRSADSKTVRSESFGWTAQASSSMKDEAI